MNHEKNFCLKPHDCFNSYPTCSEVSVMLESLTQDQKFRLLSKKIQTPLNNRAKIRVTVTQDGIAIVTKTVILLIMVLVSIPA